MFRELLFKFKHSVHSRYSILKCQFSNLHVSFVIPLFIVIESRSIIVAFSLYPRMYLYIVYVVCSLYMSLASGGRISAFLNQHDQTINYLES